MSERRSLFEHLSVELFHLIFEYLAPHDLLFAFKNLNQRFTAILAQQPLCLPNNRHMSLDLYYNYITSIIPNHVSQIVYLHLSERRAPHAVDSFLSEVPLKTLTWPALKAVTIEDVPFHIFESLLYDSLLLSNVHLLSFDIRHDRYHHSEYDDFFDFGIVVPLLNRLPELRSLYLSMTTHMNNDYALQCNQYCLSLAIHQNLHTLMIVECSRELFVKLLNNGHLPKLCQLRVALSCTHTGLEIEPPCPTPLKQASVPKLRHVNIKIFVGVAWLLTFFEDLQRHSQLEQFNISGHVRFTLNSNFPRVVELQRWLTLTKSKVFTFQMKLSTDVVLGAEEIRKNVFVEYRQATGDDSSAKYGDINIRYPAMSFSHQIETSGSGSEDEDSNNTTSSSDVIPDEPVDDNIEEMEIVDLDYIEDELLENIQAVRRWHFLRKITIEGDYPDDNGIVGGNIPHLLHIAQRSPHFRELHINADLDFGRILSSNVELGILLISQLEILYFTAKDSDCSLGDLVEIVDTLFSHSLSSSPLLKQLTLHVDGHPSSWLSVHHLVDEIGKILDRFPALIHFTLYCEHAAAFQNNIYNLSELAPQWYVKSLLTRPTMKSSLIYRHKPHSLDIWL